MRSLLYLGGGLLIGAGLSWAEAARHAEKNANARMLEELASHKRAVQQAAENYLAETPAATEDDLVNNGFRFDTERIDTYDGVDTSDDSIKVGGEMVVESPAMSISPDYLASARDYSDTPLSNPQVELEYITEDEYDEEDGRDKEQIMIHMGETEPLFISQGIVVPNWDELISPNILAHIYQACPPGTDKVVYVRNHRLDTDYQVIQELPGG